MHTQEIATIGRTVVSQRPEFTDEQVNLIKRTVAAGTTNDELKLFLYQCQRTGLDPLAKQIYCIVRGQGDRRKATIQTAIDGYRLIADRTGLYCGNDDAVFEIENGKPVTATVTVWKLVGGVRCPFTASARFNEYRPEKYGNNTRPDMWDRMPFVMLGKVAEALALRKAFPADLSGVYTQEEMVQAIPPGSHEEAPAAPRTIAAAPSTPPTPDESASDQGELVAWIKSHAPAHPKVKDGTIGSVSPKLLEKIKGSIEAAQASEANPAPAAPAATPTQPSLGGDQDYVCDAVHEDGVRQCINSKPHNKAHVWEQLTGTKP